ncbi:MAG: pentapeptide repeat-containing protein [Planctomycetia bacterium]|nr:pentapeptide repeat-containing protein [Planctomycetia bacterium]
MAKQPKKSAAKKPDAKKADAKKPVKAKKKLPPDWVAILRSGADGVKKWNKLTLAERRAIKLAGADLSGCDLTGVKLSGVNAAKINLSGSTLTKARFDDSDFENASFASANLSEMVYGHLTATGADFTGAKLVNVNLRMSSLSRTTFAGADLTGAQLDASKLHGTDFSTATLTGVTWTGAEFTAETKWPADFVIPGELKWFGRTTDPRLSGKGKKAVATDINGLMARLHATIDEKRMQRTLDMLKKERNQIFSVVEPTMVRGIVRSQRDIDTVYSCVLTEDGTYSCGTPDMAQCMGLSNEPCKHLLVLLIGLSRAGELDPATADKWIVAAKTKNPRWNKTVQNYIADSFLKYKGAQAGEIDWRPTETIPEDFYAM